MKVFNKPWLIALLVLVSILSFTAHAQQIPLSDYVIFGGAANCSGCAVQIGTNSTVVKGAIGSYNAITSSGSNTLGGKLTSGGTIVLGNGVTASSTISAANTSNATGTIFQVGTKASLKDNIDVKGNISISSGTVYGKVTHPSGTTYKGPTPRGGQVIGTPTLPQLPQLPAITTFPASGTVNITATQSITPGAYGNVRLSGDQTLTLNGPGTYIFKSIANNGNFNKIVFDFKTTPAGDFKIFVEGDVNLNKLFVDINNGGDPSHIYAETHGNGATNGSFAWSLAPGSSGSRASEWYGTVYAPNGGIKIGSSSDIAKVVGALWSNKQVQINNGTTVDYMPYKNTNTVIIPYYPPPTTGKNLTLIGSELSSLYANRSNISAEQNEVFVIQGDNVFIEVIAINGQYQNLLALLQTPEFGMTSIFPNDPSTLVITGKIPIANLIKINDLTDKVAYCRPLLPPVSNAGSVTSAGDTSMLTQMVRNGFDVEGEGVKIGVISNGYNTLKTPQNDPALINVQNGDLPGVGNPYNHLDPVHVLTDFTFYPVSDEGRAMLQIVHDIAPKAKLAFRTGYISAGDFAQAIDDLQKDGCDEIVDDITFITEPYFQDGVVAKKVNEVVDKGVTYFSAAGNYGHSSYQHQFVAAPAPNGIVGNAHNFGGGDIYQKITLAPGNYTIALQWNEPFYSLMQGGAHTDLDIYLTNNDGSTLFGFNRNNIDIDPIEILPFTVLAPTETNIMIIRAAGTANVDFKYIIFRGNAVISEYNSGTSTVVGQANAEKAIAVGAVLFSNTPAYGVNPPTIASFSSQGGMLVNGQDRKKPNIVAPNGVNTTVALGGVDIDANGVPNFFGTSAAAPHAAGAAALLLSAKKKYDNSILSPTAVKNLLQSTALDMGASGYDVATGYGFIQPFAALSTFATPHPEITGLVLPSPSYVPGGQPFTLKITGNYLTASTKILFRADTLPTTLTNNELSATIPSFTGNPAIHLYTAPKSSSKKDGGASDSLYFFTAAPKKVLITIDNKTKKFGERLPDFTATVTVDGHPLSGSGLTLHDLGLDPINFHTPATSTDPVGVYLITMDKVTDEGLNELYKYEYTTGQLVIQKMPVTITPDNKTVTYGERFNSFTFHYDFDNSLIPVNERTSFLQAIQTEHLANMADAVALVDGKALVNGRALVNADLDHLSFLVSGKALVNGRALVNGKALVNGVPTTITTNIVDVAPESVFKYETDPATTTLVSARALVNSRALVNAKALVNGRALVNGKALVNGATSIVNSDNVGDGSISPEVVIIDAEDVAADVPLTNFKSINLITGITAGTSAIVPGALLSSNYDVSYNLGTLTINPAILTVAAVDTGVNQGEAVALRATFAGYQYDDTTSTVVASGPTFTLLNSSGAAVSNNNLTAGVYTIVPGGLQQIATPPNYTANYVNGTLYINPVGGNAKNVKPSLTCVEPLVNDPSGYTYVAHFSYTNPNGMPIYVPIGPDNQIITSGRYGLVQPHLFMPGTYSFDIYFDGQSLTWQLNTYNGKQKSSTASNASSTSARCKTSNTIAKNSIEATDRTNGGEVNGVYPNPARNTVTLRVNSANVQQQDITISDAAGHVYPVVIRPQASSATITLDVSGLAKGLYMIKVKASNGYKVFKVIKL